MIEVLGEPNTLELFKNYGIHIKYVYSRVKTQKNDQSIEIDLMLERGTQDEILWVEAKSKLGVDDVRDLLAELAIFTQFSPRYANYQIYGAVAGLDMLENADCFADRQGLFVLKWLVMAWCKSKTMINSNRMISAAHKWACQQPLDTSHRRL